MNPTSPIPSSSTDLFDSDTPIVSPDPILASPGQTPTFPDSADAATQIGRSASRTARGLVVAFYLGVRPVIHDERANTSPRVWCSLHANNQTAPSSGLDEIIQRALTNALTSMPPEDIQDGMTLPLGVALASCVRDFGERGLSKLASVAATTAVDPEVLSHALRWIGRLDDPESLHGRLRLLIRVLNAPSATVRDGAALGLVELGSPLAVRPLEEAASNEVNQTLREDLKQAAGYLSRRS